MATRRRLTTKPAKLERITEPGSHRLTDMADSEPRKPVMHMDKIKASWINSAYQGAIHAADVNYDNATDEARLARDTQIALARTAYNEATLAADAQFGEAITAAWKAQRTAQDIAIHVRDTQLDELRHGITPDITPGITPERETQEGHTQQITAFDGGHAVLVRDHYVDNTVSDTRAFDIVHPATDLADGVTPMTPEEEATLETADTGEDTDDIKLCPECQTPNHQEAWDDFDGACPNCGTAQTEEQ